MTRDDGLAHKPAPDGVLHACAAMGVSPAETLVVGDFLLDVAGREGGRRRDRVPDERRLEPGEPAPARSRGRGETAPAERAVREPTWSCTAWPSSPRSSGSACRSPPASCRTTCSPGIWPASPPAPEVIVAAGVGEDVAALDIRDDEVLAVHGDPITLATGTWVRRPSS